MLRQALLRQILWRFYSAAAFCGALMFGAFLSAQSVDPDLSLGEFPAVVPESIVSRAVPDQRVRQYIIPQRVVWKSGAVDGEEKLLTAPLGQTSTAAMTDGFHMKKLPGEECAILLDLGTEIHGAVRLEARGLTPADPSLGKNVRVRVRFGESADEAMASVGEKGAVNEHSIRDMVVSVPWLGEIEFGESAFRFIRLDLVDDGAEIWFDSVRAVFVYRPLEQPGSFTCSDSRLNDVWRTCAYTQFLTMQGYIVEGAKRDRLVWYGDFHPQASTTLAVFGAPKVLRDTLGDYARNVWVLPNWMNSMPNYSLWWTISVSDLFRYSGDRAWLEEQAGYLRGLFERLKGSIAEDGRASFPNPFLDWPTNDKPEAMAAGTHALFAVAMDRFAEMAQALGDTAWQNESEELAAKIRSYHPNNTGNKQAAALLAIAGIDAADTPNIDVVARGGAEGFSTFYGFYMLEALALGGQKQLAVDVIRRYWGAMLDVGATTFWEDFDLRWLENAGRIDELTAPGRDSLHGDRGAYCYVGLRHSLCHGWASGPAAWMTARILGVSPAEPGYKSFRFEPFLGDLTWAQGDVPTPYGPIHVRLDKAADGSIQSTVRAPEGVVQVK